MTAFAQSWAYVGITGHMTELVLEENIVIAGGL